MTQNPYEEYPPQRPAPQPPQPDVVEWVDPPAEPKTRLDRVYDALVQHPGQWALIQRDQSFAFFTWWGRLREDPDFEVRMVSRQPGKAFATHDVYARYMGDESYDLLQPGRTKP